MELKAMSTNKMLSLVIVSGMVAFGALPARAESLPALEAAQIANSTSLNVDAGASKGTDESLVSMERDQFGNSAEPDVDASASRGHDKSIVGQELEQIPH
jgi:hypothetical protein